MISVKAFLILFPVLLIVLAFVPAAIVAMRECR